MIFFVQHCYATIYKKSSTNDYALTESILQVIDALFTILSTISTTMIIKVLLIYFLTGYLGTYTANEHLKSSKTPLEILTNCSSQLISNSSTDFNLLHRIFKRSRVNKWKLSKGDLQQILKNTKMEKLQSIFQSPAYSAFNKLLKQYTKAPSRDTLKRLYHAFHIPLCSPLEIINHIEVFHNQPPDSGDFPEAFIEFINQMYFIPFGDLRIAAYQLNHPDIIRSISELAKWIEPQRIKIILEEDYLHKDKLRNDQSNHINPLKSLLEAGVQIRTDVSPQSRGNGQAHHKFGLIGESQLFTGSWNFTIRGTSRNHNHAFWIVSKELVRSYSHEFNQIWSGKSQANKLSDWDYNWNDLEGGKARVLFAPQDPIKEAIIASLQKAQKSILVSLFFLTDLDLLNLLKVKKYEGVEVKLIIDNLGIGSKVGKIGKPLREVLFDFGLDFWTDDGSGHWHHKIAIVDKRMILSGSANWSQAAFKKNDENLLQIENQKLAHKLYSLIIEQNHFTHHKTRKTISLPEVKLIKNYWQIYRQNNDLKVKLPSSQHDIIVLFNQSTLDSIYSSEIGQIFIKKDFFSNGGKEGLLSLYKPDINQLDGVFINNGDGKLSAKSIKQIKSLLVRNPKAPCKPSIEELETCFTPKNFKDSCISSEIGNWMKLAWHPCADK